MVLIKLLLANIKTGAIDRGYSGLEDKTCGEQASTETHLFMGTQTRLRPLMHEDQWRAIATLGDRAPNMQPRKALN